HQRPSRPVVLQILYKSGNRTIGLLILDHFENYTTFLSLANVSKHNGIMNKLLSIALLALIAVACQQTQKQQEETPQADPNAITCDGIGPVKLAYSYAALDSAVGANNLENGTTDVDG